MRHAFLILTVATACGSDVSAPESPTTIGPAAFARVLGDLVVARVEILPDTAAFLERRDAILSASSVTVEDLSAFVAARGADDDVMSAVYRRVETRLDALPPRTTPPSSP